MRIRSNFFVSLDGFVGTPDGRPVQLLLPNWRGRDSYGLPEFLASTQAVVMGRTTFLPALGAPQWPWVQPVFVLTSSPLPASAPADVHSAPTAAELVAKMEAAGITGDVHLVGGPTTVAAFHEIEALSEAWFHVIPMVLGTGIPLAPAAGAPLPLELAATNAWPDGVVELRYRVGRSS